MANHTENEKKPFYKKWWVWLIVIIIIIGIGGNYSNKTSDTDSTPSSDNINTINTTNTIIEESKEEYISKCEVFTFRDVARNPNNYINKRVKFTGEVIQVQEGYSNSLALRVNVTKGEYGIWEDTIWVDYKYKTDNESKILEDDIIDLYGEFKGQKSYTSVLGAQVNLPQIEAQYIDIQQ